MLELPESHVIARQLEKEFAGQTIASCVAGQSPHRFAFFKGDPAGYNALLEKRTVQGVESRGIFIKLALGDTSLVLGDGISASYHAPGKAVPDKHQLLVRFENGSALTCRVTMYGAMLAQKGEPDNPYYATAHEKPDALGNGFTEAYFDILRAEAKSSLSLKAFLATEQRIPGLGNGVLQDILWQAQLHPRTVLGTLDDAAFERLYQSLRATMAAMESGGGRDTEKDIYGKPGGYTTVLSAKHLKEACPRCGGTKKKQAYLGGSIYWCESCQPV